MAVTRTAVRWCIALSAAIALPLGAQTPSGAVDMSGRVFAQIYVVIHDSTHYAHPQLGAALQVVSVSGATVPVKTDAAGVATAWLTPGQYRVATTSPVTWDGRAYAWDQAVDVAPGMATVELNERNASAVAGMVTRERIPAPPASASMRFDRKDPALATVFSFLVPGIGQFYAGAPGKGAAFLAGDIVATGAVLYGATCMTGDDGCTIQTRNKWLTAGATLAVLNTVFSMADAYGSAGDYNRRHGALGELKRARPMVAMGQRGEAHVGLSFAYRQ